MKNATRFFFFLLLPAFPLCGCHKAAGNLLDKATHSVQPGQFQTYTIRAGAQYCDQSGYKPVEVSEMKFAVRFDSSAIYRTLDPVNQYDINKLYGFADNASDHHQYSARFGWRWSEGALRLFAYVYNAGVVSSEELTTVPIGAEITCSIKVSGNQYVFSVNDLVRSMPRAATTEKGKGYQLYPYFGGDESAPHDIRIFIRDL